MHKLSVVLSKKELLWQHNFIFLHGEKEPAMRMLPLATRGIGGDIKGARGSLSPYKE